MSEKLSWDQIEMLYDKEWVELIDYEWPFEEINPRSGIVRVHAKARSEFDRLCAALPPLDAAAVYVGNPEIPGEIINTFRHIEVKPITA